MLSTLVIVATMVGQQAVYLGKPGNVFGATVATNEAAMRIDELHLKDRDPKDVTQSVGVAGVAYGTRVRVLRPTILEIWRDGRLKTIPGLWIEILDGPLVGSEVVVDANHTHKGPISKAPTQPRYKSSGKPLATVWLGGDDVGGVRLSPIVASSLDELAGVDILPGEIDARGVKQSPAPRQVAQLGFGTRAAVYEVVPFTSELEGDDLDQHAAVVKILDGPAVGRFVYADMRDVSTIKP